MYLGLHIEMTYTAAIVVTNGCIHRETHTQSKYSNHLVQACQLRVNKVSDGYTQ